MRMFSSINKLKCEMFNIIVIDFNLSTLSTLHRNLNSGQQQKGGKVDVATPPPPPPHINHDAIVTVR